MSDPVAPIHCLPPAEHRARRLAVAMLLMAPLAFGFLAVALGQDANWDLRNYHWYNAYAFLNGRLDKDLLPSQTPWFYNPTLDVPFYLLAKHVPAIAAGFILGAVQGLNFVLLFMLAHVALVIPNPRHKVFICGLLAALGMVGGGGIALIGTTFYDNVTSLGLFLSALLVVRHQPRLMESTQREALRTALLAGIPAGLAIGLKLPCFTFGFGLAAALLCMSGSAQRRLIIFMAFGVGLAVGTAITLGHWAWYLETHFGSPLFPYFNEIFKAPLAPPSSARDIEYVPHGLHDNLLFPYIFTASPYRTGEIPFRDWRIPILYSLLPIAVLVRMVFGRSRQTHDVLALPAPARYLLWATVLSYGAWLMMFGIYRYIVPIEMLTPLLIVCAVGLLPLKPLARTMLAAFILLVVAASVQPGNWSRRDAWLDHFIEAEIPPLGDTSNTMLLMAGFEPYAHMVTSFPPEMPVVRIQSNFASPEQGKPINNVIESHLASHQGRFLLLIPNYQHKVAEASLALFHMRADWHTCQTVHDRLYVGGSYDLCSVARTGE